MELQKYLLSKVEHSSNSNVNKETLFLQQCSIYLLRFSLLSTIGCIIANAFFASTIHREDWSSTTQQFQFFMLSLEGFLMNWMPFFILTQIKGTYATHFIQILQCQHKYFLYVTLKILFGSGLLAFTAYFNNWWTHMPHIISLIYFIFFWFPCFLLVALCGYLVYVYKSVYEELFNHHIKPFITKLENNSIDIEYNNGNNSGTKPYTTWESVKYDYRAAYSAVHARNVEGRTLLEYYLTSILICCTVSFADYYVFDAQYTNGCVYFLLYFIIVAFQLLYLFYRIWHSHDVVKNELEHFCTLHDVTFEEREECTYISKRSPLALTIGRSYILDPYKIFLIVLTLCSILLGRIAIPFNNSSS